MSGASMKYLIVVLVVVVVAWLLLRGAKRVPPPQPRAKAPAAPASLQAMLQCDHCGVHMPRAEALLDERGAFCSEAHRLAGPRPH